MPAASKIATCCYCGTRAALVFKEQGRHELACSSCGAPLHDLKAIPVQKHRAEREAAYSAKPKKSGGKSVKSYKKPRKKLKSKKKFAKKFFEEAFDIIEDIFD
ncbi:MAG: hypothetical protein GY883_18550 [Shimia sp.]|nr:hypothetical protein [Shimia sp.]